MCFGERSIILHSTMSRMPCSLIFSVEGYSPSIHSISMTSNFWGSRADGVLMVIVLAVISKLSKRNEFCYTASHTLNTPLFGHCFIGLTNLFALYMQCVHKQ